MAKVIHAILQKQTWTKSTRKELGDLSFEHPIIQKENNYYFCFSAIDYNFLSITRSIRRLNHMHYIVSSQSGNGFYNIQLNELPSPSFFSPSSLITSFLATWMIISILSDLFPS
jgi:hypothetical protein